jgi:TPR repeat protein
LGDLYKIGKGVSQSDELAAHWYQKAIDNKDFKEEKRSKAREALTRISNHASVK